MGSLRLIVTVAMGWSFWGLGCHVVSPAPMPTPAPQWRTPPREVSFCGLSWPAAAEEVWCSTADDIDVAPLADLPRLRTLRLHAENGISGLHRLPRLRRLELALDRAELPSLAGLDGLETLKIDAPRLCTMEQVERLGGLVELEVDALALTDLRPLALLERLERLRLENVDASYLGPLVHSDRLSHLDLINTCVEDIVPLEGVRQLRHLRLDRSPVRHLWPVAYHRFLRRLSLRHTHVEHITKRHHWARLVAFDALGTPLRDADFLLRAQYLRAVDLRGSEVVDVSAVAAARPRARLRLQPAVSREGPRSDCGLPPTSTSLRAGAGATLRRRARALCAAKQTTSPRLRASYRRAVDRMAHQRSVHGKFVLGRPSPHYEAFERLVALATPSQLIALLRHPSPVLRGYVARHIGWALPRLARHLAPALDDDTQVVFSSGCGVTRRSIHALAQSALCGVVEIHPETGHEAAAVLLREAHHPNPMRRKEARRCLTSLSP